MKFKVGDKVKSNGMTCGSAVNDPGHTGVVIEVRDAPDRTYPIDVRWDNGREDVHRSKELTHHVDAQPTIEISRVVEMLDDYTGGKFSADNSVYQELRALAVRYGILKPTKRVVVVFDADDDQEVGAIQDTVRNLDLKIGSIEVKDA